MYLADRDIRALLDELSIEAAPPAAPFDADQQIQPCSIDLRVSSVFWKPSRRRGIRRLLVTGRRPLVDLRHAHLHDIDPLRDWQRQDLSEGDSVTIRPGEAVMARIHERVRVPAGYAGKVEGRSSYSRLGLAVHCTGDFINPGWSGFMPLQLHNAGPYPIRVTPFIPICQLKLVRLSSTPSRSYGDDDLRSKYVNDDGGPSLWWRDGIVEDLHARLGELNTSERIQREIVDRVRFRDPDLLERFQHHLNRQTIGSVESASDVLDRFAVDEDRRRLIDRFSAGVAGVAASALVGALFVSGFGLAKVLVAVGFAVSGGFAIRGQMRRSSGYLGRAEVLELSRPT